MRSGAMQPLRSADRDSARTSQLTFFVGRLFLGAMYLYKEILQTRLQSVNRLEETGLILPVWRHLTLCSIAIRLSSSQFILSR